MKTIYLSGQNNFGNRGCEALVRSTVALLNKHLGAVRVLVPSLDIPRDAAQWPDAADDGVEFVSASVPPAWWSHWDRICRRVPMLTRLPALRLTPDVHLARNLWRCDALLMIGGDNYSLDYDLASLFHFVGEAEAAMRLGKHTVLWGASVGPFSRLPGVERQLYEHMKRLSLITVRESASVDYLKKLGLANSVLPVTDSAFCMAPQAFDVGALFANPHGVLGLNVSPLIERILARSGRPGALRREVVSFIRKALAEYPFSIMLIPHVAPLAGSALGGDELTHQEIFETLGAERERVQIAPTGLNAPQLKYLISKCKYFIGARTHATIAAMSTGVPVISVAYSVKAKGLNRDLFGHERYMLPTSELSAESLQRSLEILVTEEDSIRELLSDRIAVVRERADAGAAWLASRMQAH
ncbi:polysaccharide pyruvyl transferase [Azoarcus sp. CIB]|uniref:polysaccharide pyruvyl transferase family protein n=1 Tax=Aromatoleum sp. (strain CIB) TaxID=198107 RepID=UPI00067DB5E3|nr:polysaccharide pyruvyl transferase family protein [Azoarcus sp. CIB]AKU11734.1 polysaccharide pyruvyl transferase [Azoarcus sp. CIB]